jgi:hypothetical protein
MEPFYYIPWILFIGVALILAVVKYVRENKKNDDE